MGDWRRRCVSFECSTPLAIVSRWLASLKRGKEREEALNLDIGIEWRRGKKELHAKCLTKCMHEELVPEANLGTPAIKGRESKNDATFKMMELRAQMESIVQNVKNELQVIDLVSKASNTRRTVDYSTTEVEESMNSNGYFSHNDHTPFAEFHDRERQRHGRSSERWSSMKEMEIELESELKDLQLLCDSDGHLDPDQSSNDGVPPEELALRLHEVLEARQEEQIKELEAALHHVRQKLEEKETEASWWKETAQLFSQRLPQVSDPNFRRLPAPPELKAQHQAS